jgi:hypothetical protein
MYKLWQSGKTSLGVHDCNQTSPWRYSSLVLAWSWQEWKSRSCQVIQVEASSAQESWETQTLFCSPDASPITGGTASQKSESQTCTECLLLGACTTFASRCTRSAKCAPHACFGDTRLDIHGCKSLKQTCYSTDSKGTAIQEPGNNANVWVEPGSAQKVESKKGSSGSTRSAHTCTTLDKRPGVHGKALNNNALAQTAREVPCWMPRSSSTARYCTRVESENSSPLSTRSAQSSMGHEQTWTQGLGIHGCNQGRPWTCYLLSQAQQASR